MAGERTVRILTGFITITFLGAVAGFAIRYAGGALDDTYTIEGTFTAAGQGLIRNSDVKVHGVDIGRVSSVRLVDGQAVVRMRIDADQKVPVESQAVIRAKTLFGEKFVDVDPGPVEQEEQGPFLGDGDRLRHTLGGFELERVLAETYPILQAIDPEELAVVLGTLAEGGRGLGPEINRQLAAWAEVADVQAAHAADTQQFLEDLAALSDELALRADDLVGAAEDLNVALPALNAQGDDLAVFLDQAARLSADLADVLEANRPFLEKNVVQGGKALELLFEHRAQLPPLVTGLRQFAQTFAEVTRLPSPDGGTQAAIKFAFGGGPPCGRTPTCPAFAGERATGAGAGPTRTGGLPLPGGLPPLIEGLVPSAPPVPLPEELSGGEAVLSLAQRLLEGP